MSEHTAEISWSRQRGEFTYDSFSRDHAWRFDAGIEVPASSAPGYLGNPARVDPEEAFVASISSCHMLTFLALAARKRLAVEAYRDSAVGLLDKNAEGRLAIVHVTLRPAVRFAEPQPAAAVVARLHEQAHRHCFIANSVACEVRVE